MSEIKNNDYFQEKAKKILEIVQKMFDYQQANNQYAIRKDNEYFLIRDGKVTGIIRDEFENLEYLEYKFDTTDRDGFRSIAKNGYENEGMHGIIKKRVNHNNTIPSEYAIETALEYKPGYWFAKISIKYPTYRDSDIIEIKGQDFGPHDRYYDKDLLTILDRDELDLYLNQITTRLTKMYQDMLIDVERFDEEDYLRNKEYVKKLAKQRETDKK